MKKYLYFSIAALALVSCSDDEYIGQGAGTGQKDNLDNAIMIGGSTAAFTRSEHDKGDAAELLGNNFVVEGIKGDGIVANQKEVFDHYNVNYKESTANTTESNTNDWEYVGIGKHGLSASSSQTIKYWDYSTTQYDFIAFSYGKSNYEKAVLTEIQYNKLGQAVDATGHENAVYTVTGKAEELAKTYIADLVTKYNRDGVSEYKTVVTPKFRSMGTKVRLAFYETVPGYSVKNLKFYNAAWDGTTATTDDGADEATLFAASTIFPGTDTKGTMSVYYPTVGWDNAGKASDPIDPDYNQAHVKFTVGNESEDALLTTKTFGELDYTNKGAAAEGTEKNASGKEFLGRTSSTATYAGSSTDNYYTIVLPLGTKDNLQIRVEYDLIPTDGAEEVIHVRDARAVVPAAYADWKPNYAYTYIFKISDNTNGWTGVDGDDNVVEGITPITFDAVVVDTEDGIQETITTVATPSITTYQKGINVSSYNEYEAGDIYASVMNGTTAVDLSSLTAPAGVAVYTATTTNTIEGITEETVTSNLMGHDNGITLTSCGYEIVSKVPAADGNTLAVSAAKFTVASGKTYVFMYTDGSKNYVKVIKVQ